MSTEFRAPSQVRPNAFYRVRANSTQLFTETGANAITVSADTILQDMGKTVYLGNSANRGDNILRKVKVLDAADPAKTAYIYLVKAGGVAQDIAAL
jgi:hypothetical protein